MGNSIKILHNDSNLNGTEFVEFVGRVMTASNPHEKTAKRQDSHKVCRTYDICGYDNIDEPLEWIGDEM